MSVAPHRQVLKAISAYLLLVSLFGPRAFSQQGVGSIKGTVTDQLGGAVFPEVYRHVGHVLFRSRRRRRPRRQSTD